MFKLSIFSLLGRSMNRIRIKTICLEVKYDAAVLLFCKVPGEITHATLFWTNLKLVTK